MQQCGDCLKVYDESEDTHCPYVQMIKTTTIRMSLSLIKTLEKPSGALTARLWHRATSLG